MARADSTLRLAVLELFARRRPARDREAVGSLAVYFEKEITGVKRIFRTVQSITCTYRQKINHRGR